MRARTGRESGFLLIGVIMFVLALTILGISLYSLSSYEAEFQMRSRDSGQAFYAAQGGMDLVLALLASTDSLGSARQAIGHQGIFWAVAKQRKAFPAGSFDSTGTLRPDSTVFVTVLTREGHDSRTLTARYIPTNVENYYKRLVTAANYVKANIPVGGSPKSTTLSGVIWNGAADSGGDPAPDSLAILSHVDGWDNRRPGKRGPVPLPDLASYYASHPVAFSALVDSGTPYVIHLTDPNHGAGPSAAVYGNPFGDDMFRIFPKDVDVQLSGNVIWLMPLGFYASHLVRLFGSGTLIVVGSANGVLTATGDADVGIYFAGGLNTQNDINVVLVSDAKVKIEQSQNGAGSDGRVPNLSVYGRSFDSHGPILAGAVQELTYDPGDMNDVIDQLIGQNALPHPLGATPSEFVFLPGSWQDLTP